MRDADHKENKTLGMPRNPISYNETSLERCDLEQEAVTNYPELLHDNGPDPRREGASASMKMLGTTKDTDGKCRPAGLELIDGADAAVGPIVQFDDKISQKMMDEKCQAEMNSNYQASDDGSSTSAPEDLDSSLQCTAASNPRFMTFQSGGEQAAVGSLSGMSTGDTIDASRIAGRQTIVTATTATTTQDGTSPLHQETSVRGIAEAYLVDEELIFATPAKPWWKQRRTMLLLAIVTTAVVIAIALAVLLSSGDKTTTTQLSGIFSPSPSISIPPTSSMIPSSSPTKCSDIITSSAQQITLLNPNPRYVSTALDGTNLLVASIWNSDVTVSRSFYIEFYVLENGTWERIGHFIKGNIDWKVNMIDDLYFTTDLSGRTAVIGVPSGGNFVDEWSKDGEIFVYKQNAIGLWEEVDSPRPANRTGYCSFGESIDIDGDLLVVIDEWFCNLALSTNAAYIFRQYGNEWNEIRILDREDITSIEHIVVQGNTIALADGFSCLSDNSPFIDIYAVNENESNVTHVQRIEPGVDSILFLSIEGNQLLSLVTAGREDGTNDHTILVYARENATEPFTLLQSINASEYGDGSIGQNFAFDGNLLVMEGQNTTHIFSRQLDGILVETLTLDQSFNRYELSGNNLIGVTDNVAQSMSLEGCMIDIPTVAPSVTASRQCEWVDVTFSCNPDRRLQVYTVDTACIVLSEYLAWYNGFWEARIETSEFLESDAEIVAKFKKPDDAPVLDSYPGLEHQYSFKDSACIYPGQYQFVFRAVSSGNADPYYIHYRVETNGKVIAQEQVSLEPYRDEIDQRHKFNIPFDPSEGDFPTGGPLTPKPTTSSATPYPSWSTPFPTRIDTLATTPQNSLQSSNSPQAMLPTLDR